MLRRVVLALCGLALLGLLALIGLAVWIGDGLNFDFDVAEEGPAPLVAVSLPDLRQCVEATAPDHPHLDGSASYRATQGHDEFAVVIVESPPGIGGRAARQAVDDLLGRFSLDSVVAGAVLLRSNDRDSWAMSLVGPRDLPARSVAQLLDDTVPVGWGGVVECELIEEADPVSD